MFDDALGCPVHADLAAGAGLHDAQLYRQNIAFTEAGDIGL
ncbi:MAG: hypothetical protein ACK4FP_04860 [Azonexus sp.]